MAGHPCSNGEVLGRLATPTRNKYFYGKLMDAFHFDLEQFYGVQKRSLINRLALGHGVLCGLQVAPTGDGRHVVVGQGVCIDSLGREIVVPEQSRAVDPRQITDDCGRPTGEPLVGANVVHICIAYHECESEPVPVLLGDCDTKTGCAASVVRERYQILVRKGSAPEIKPACGFSDLFAASSKAKTTSPFYSELVSRISGPCPAPAGSCVVLAEIDLPEGKASITEKIIDPSVRPLVYSNELLFELLLCVSRQGQFKPATPMKFTNITKLSWDHSKNLTLNKFMAGLNVTFSDRLTATTKQGQAWFMVTVEYPVGKLDKGRPVFMPGTILVQHVLADKIEVTGDTASFEPDEAFKKTFTDTVETLRLDEPPLCRVVLKCNALKDANGHAADGDFLLGTLPSGDGTPGGDFESWFTLSSR